MFKKMYLVSHQFLFKNGEDVTPVKRFREEEEEEEEEEEQEAKQSKIREEEEEEKRKRDREEYDDDDYQEAKRIRLFSPHKSQNQRKRDREEYDDDDEVEAKRIRVEHESQNQRKRDREEYNDDDDDEVEAKRIRLFSPHKSRDREEEPEATGVQEEEEEPKKRGRPRTFCYICKRNFKNTTNFNKHVKVVHEGKRIDKDNMIGSAPKKFHVIEDDINKLKPFICAFCGNSFKYRTEFDKHLRRDHKQKVERIVIKDEFKNLPK